MRALVAAIIALIVTASPTLCSERYAMSTEHFVIDYPEGAHGRAMQVGRDLEEALPTLAHGMDVELDERVRVRLFRTRKAMYEALGSEPDSMVMGIALGSRNEILLGIFGNESLKRTAAHELAHIILHHRFGDMHSGDQPRWLHEGYAQLATQELTASQRRVLGEAALADELLDIDALEKAFGGDSHDVALAYAEAFALVSYLHGLRPDGGLAELVDNLEQTGDLDRAFIRTYSMDRAQIETEWMKRMRSEHLSAGLPLSIEIVIFGAMAVIFLITLVVVNRRRAAIRERLREQEIARALAHSHIGRLPIDSSRGRADDGARPGEER